MTHSCLGRYNPAGCKTLVTSNLLIHVSQYKLSSWFWVFFYLLCLHMNFHSLFFWLSTIFQLHSLICTDICLQNEYFLQLKGETGSWGGLGGEVFTRFTPKTGVCVIYVRGFYISTWSSQVNAKITKHLHNATFSVGKKEDFEDLVMFRKKYSAYYSC